MRTIAVVISVAALGVIAAACGGERSAVTSTAAPTINPHTGPCHRHRSAAQGFNRHYNV